MFDGICFTQIMIDAIGCCSPYIAVAVFVDLPDQGINIIPAAKGFRPAVVGHDAATRTYQELVVAGFIETEDKVVVEGMIGTFT